MGRQDARAQKMCGSRNSRALLLEVLRVQAGRMPIFEVHLVRSVEILGWQRLARRRGQLQSVALTW